MLVVASVPEARASQVWFDCGPTFSLPIPAASANRSTIGLDAGLSCTGLTSSWQGIGPDVTYHYWPVSAKFKQDFNRLMHQRTWSTLELGGGTWGVQVLQFGVHMRAAPPAAAALRSWLQLGAAVYRVDPSTTGYSGDAGFFTVTAPPLKTVQYLGWSVALGTDLLGGPRARVGLDATCHVVNCRKDYGQNLRVFTLGAHTLFGW